MAIAASLREDASSLHWQQVAELAAAVARPLDLAPQTVARCELGGLVHDIGKVALPEGLLLKRGPLDPGEWSLMRAHSEVGEQMAREACVLEAVAEIVRHHHERFDGTGYPDGLAGTAIPVEARIVAACDAYSAMTTERPYQRARSQDDAIEELRRSAGSHLDPAVVEALIAELGARREAAARHFGTWAA
jgi:putative nucleotidyltransferase with HDIG domain